MNKTIMILICFALLFLLGGFFVGAASTDNVFFAISAMLIGMLFMLSAVIPAARLVQKQNRQKEDRIKKIEEEVEQLKRNNHH